MLKKNILIFSLIGLVLLFCACGKKGDPLPVGLPLPGGINDLAGEVKDGVLFLSFAIPQKNRDGSPIKDLAGFKLFKRCGTCTGEYELYKDISLESKQGYTTSRGRFYIYDDDLMNGYQYGYKIYPYTKNGTRGDASSEFVIPKWEIPPEAPKGVKASVDDRSVTLKWPKEGAFLYNVYRIDEGRYAMWPLNPKPLTTDFFADGNLVNGQKYVYDVRKVKTGKIGVIEGPGKKIEATPMDKTPPGAPAMIKAQKKGKTVSITWKANTEPDLAGYNVYRISGRTKERLNRSPVKENTFLDEKLLNERFVAYAVSAVDNAGNESELSQESIVILKE